MSRAVTEIFETLARKHNQVEKNTNNLGSGKSVKIFLKYRYFYLLLIIIIIITIIIIIIVIIISNNYY